MLALTLELNHFFLREQLITAIRGHFIEFLQPLHRFLDRHPVGEESAQPALVHIEHSAALRFFSDGVLRLPLGAYEEDCFAGGGDVLYEFRRLFEHLEGLLQVNNVDTVALPEDVLLHPRVPTFRLMPEVNTCFEQLLHSDVSQSTSSLSLHPPLCSRLGLPFPSRTLRSGRIEHLNFYRLLYWKRLRAPFCPYFLRSLARGSRVTIPAVFKPLRSSALNSINARVMPSFTAS